MRILIFFCFLIFSSLYAQQIYKGQSQSQIDWEHLDVNEWIDFAKWRENYTKLSQISLEEKTLKNGSYKEVVGHVLHCVGECRNYRDFGHSEVVHRSFVRESDEIATESNSYLWIFLLDGTMVRLSPESSITFREINISEDDIFFHARINYGNVLWFSRDKMIFDEQTLRETETLFEPLPIDDSLFDKNSITAGDDLYKYLETSQDEIIKYQRLNLQILENNKKIKSKKSYAFIILPNGSVYGENLLAEFIVLPGKESFIKLRPSVLYNSLSDWIKTATFYFRGYDREEDKTLEENIWYKVSEDGDNIEQYAESSEFGMGELITKRIPSILIARELMFAKYSLDLFLPRLNKTTLALEDGYRLWSSLVDENGDSNKRLNFIKSYTRRMETTNLLIAKKLRRIEGYKERHAELEEGYTSKYFIRALNSYQTNSEINRPVQDREILNSTNKILWKRLQRR